MKKFITTSPRQEVLPKKGESPMPYDCKNAPKLHCPILTPVMTSFPVLPLIYGSVDEGEEFQVLVITATRDYWTETNFPLLQQAVQELATMKKTSVSVVKIEVPIDETPETHLETFGKLIEHIEQDDTLYADITYGTKPTPSIQMMALNYGYQCKNCLVDCICYGEVLRDHTTSEHKIIAKNIYDVTGMFLMQQVVNTLAKFGTANPLDTIRAILRMNEDADEEIDWDEEDL